MMAWHQIGEQPLSGMIHWRIYAALGGDELIETILTMVHDASGRHQVLSS